ncbi:putative DD41D transposase [Trichonephila clavipes]|nr:putative DD41D transposase [Trichonephila clavipes]
MPWSDATPSAKLPLYTQFYCQEIIHILFQNSSLPSELQFFCLINVYVSTPSAIIVNYTQESRLGFQLALDHRGPYATTSGRFDLLRPPCQVIYSQFGLAIHQNDHKARRRFVEWAQNEIADVPDFHKRILFSDEAHFWLNGYVNKQNCRIWSEANPQVYVETPLHPEKLTVWCALWAGGILLQKR